MTGLYGIDLFGEAVKTTAKDVLCQRFIIPPFSVLDSRGGEWTERKRAWRSIGIQSELGRDAKSYDIHEWLEKNAYSF